MGTATYEGTGHTGIDGVAVARLRQQVSGRVIEPGGNGYEEARRVWNGMIDRRPRLIVQAMDAVDVQCAVAFARERGLRLAVKGGGHNVAGHATCDDGLMIDLGAMNAVHVDPEARTALVEGGALWRDVDAATSRHGLATTGGVISSTGVGGLTLGGGIGWLVGKHGMTIDNLRSATLVTADGSVVTASPTQHPDLYWAIRGGGGNFGIAVSLELQLHPMRDVYAGYVAYPTDQARQVLRAYRDYTLAAPDEFTAYAEIARDAESGERVVVICACWSGDLADGERVTAPIRSFGTPLQIELGPVPYVAWQQAFDEEFPHGRHYFWKSNLMRDLTDDAIDAIAELATHPPVPWATAAIEWYRGAMNRVEPTATAFPHREARYQVIAIGAWDDPTEAEAGIAWARSLHAATQASALNGGFLNFNSPDAADPAERVRAGYGANWERLTRIKRRYDPENIFRQNTNIPPG